MQDYESCCAGIRPGESRAMGVDRKMVGARRAQRGIYDAAALR